MEQVILVDERDRALGVEEKLRAHRDGGMLHRAFSIFIRDPAGRVLLRSRRKYNFGGLWTYACYGHPRPGEATDRAAHRRLREELGFDVPLSEVSAFVYRAEDPGSNLTEHEYDHIFLGELWALASWCARTGVGRPILRCATAETSPDARTNWRAPAYFSLIRSDYS